MKTTHVFLQIFGVNTPFKNTHTSQIFKAARGTIQTAVSRPCPTEAISFQSSIIVCSFRDYPYSSHYDLVSDERNYFYFLFKLLNWRAVSLSDSTLTREKVLDCSIRTFLSIKIKLSLLLPHNTDSWPNASSANPLLSPSHTPDEDKGVLWGRLSTPGPYSCCSRSLLLCWETLF